MRARIRPEMLALVAGVGLVLVGAPAAAQLAGVTKDEFKCEQSTATTFVKFIGGKAKCVRKCTVAGRKTSGPYTECFAPYGGNTTTCIEDPQKGVEAKARAGIIKKCTSACPECYGIQVCTTGDPFVRDVESVLDEFAGALWCVESNGQTPTKAEAKCEDTVTKALVKFGASKIKCYQKCFTGVFKGKLTDGSCDPPTPPDTKTADCITKAETKGRDTIDASCSAVGGNPACYPGSLDTGQEWVDLAEGFLDGQVPNVACLSPS